jgi:hypothetical protein
MVDYGTKRRKLWVKMLNDEVVKRECKVVVDTLKSLKKEDWEEIINHK